MSSSKKPPSKPVPKSPTPKAKPLAKVEVIPQLVNFAGPLATKPPKKFGFVDLSAPVNEDEEYSLAKNEWGGLLAPRTSDKAFQLAFGSNPHNLGMTHAGLYRTKQVGIPDVLLKRIPTQDSLVGSIVTARQSQLEQFGSPRVDRFSKGFFFDWMDKKWYHRLDQEQRAQLQVQVRAATKLLMTCGRTNGWSKADQCSLGRWLKETVRSGLTVGRVATEVVYTCSQCGMIEECDCEGGEDEFHSFRPVDAGTILPTIRNQVRGAGDSIRERSVALLRQVYGNPELEVPSDDWDRFAFVQVIDGKEVQVFTDDQMRCKNLYPVPDVEWHGFPCTPLDTVITEVLTHISIGRHNQLYFQNGRAARGMIVITSDEVDQDMLMQIRQQFMAGINGTSHAHRMPTFGLTPGDTIQWVPIDNSSRDMEFQYLSDANVRSIMSAFQMSPEELPGYAHLSKGTASQSLSESNNEYILEAHRDLGIRPLLANIEAFINDELMPLIDSELAKICRLRLGGLEAQTKDQEDAAMERLLSIDGSLNEVLTQREKETLPRELGADVPLNAGWATLLQSYVSVGTIQEKLFGTEGASQDPRFAYVRDPFYWQQVENATSQLSMILQPPMLSIAPLVLPAVLRVMFPYLAPEQCQQAAQALMQGVQQQMLQQQQEAAQVAAQGGEPLAPSQVEDGTQDQDNAQKSELAKGRKKLLYNPGLGSHTMVDPDLLYPTEDPILRPDPSDPSGKNQLGIHPEKVEDIKKKIKAGQPLPSIKIDQEGNILDGHHRWTAAQELGLTAIAVRGEGHPLGRSEAKSELAKAVSPAGVAQIRRNISKQRRIVDDSLRQFAKGLGGLSLLIPSKE